MNFQHSPATAKFSSTAARRDNSPISRWRGQKSSAICAVSNIKADTAAYSQSMLHEFIAAKRAELIGRCREKVAKRFGAIGPRGEDLDFGCPIFLQQLAAALNQERHAGVTGAGPASAPDLSEIGLSA